MTLGEYVRLVRRGWLLLLAATLLGIGVGNLLTLVATPTYYSTASVLVAVRGDGTVGALQQGAAISNERAPTYASLATSDVVLAEAAGTSNTTVEELRSQTTVVPREEQGFIDITAGASTAAGAQARAQGVAEALGRLAPQADSPGAPSPLALQIVSPAPLPEQPTTPRPRNNVVFGAVIGLAAGIAAVVVAHALDDRVRSLGDLPRGVRFATVVSLPRAGQRGSGQRYSGTDVRLEAYRSLRANLLFGMHQRGLLAVTGVASGTGAKDVAVGLAEALAEVGLRVAVIDMDLRAAAKAGTALDGTAPAPGTVELVDGTVPLDGVLERRGGERFWSVPAGATGRGSGDQISTEAMQRLLVALQDRFDHVVLACPPVLESSDAAVVAAHSAATLLVAESGATKRADLRYAVGSLTGLGVGVVGLVLDQVPTADIRHRAMDQGPSDTSSVAGADRSAG